MPVARKPAPAAEHARTVTAAAAARVVGAASPHNGKARNCNPQGPTAIPAPQQPKECGCSRLPVLIASPAASCPTPSLPPSAAREQPWVVSFFFQKRKPGSLHLAYVEFAVSGSRCGQKLRASKYRVETGTRLAKASSQVVAGGLLAALPAPLTLRGGSEQGLRRGGVRLWSPRQHSRTRIRVAPSSHVRFLRFLC